MKNILALVMCDFNRANLIYLDTRDLRHASTRELGVTFFLKEKL